MFTLGGIVMTSYNAVVKKGFDFGGAVQAVRACNATVTQELRTIRIISFDASEEEILKKVSALDSIQAVEPDGEVHTS